MKARKKPVVIEYMIWDGSNHRGMFEFLGGLHDEFMQNQGDNFYIDHDQKDMWLVIKTLEGSLSASIGDYIIKGVGGEFYPCKPGIFLQTYDLID